VAKILNGRQVAKELRASLRERVERLETRGIRPTLKLLRVGDDPASAVYVRAKTKGSAKVGIDAETIQWPADVSEQELLARVDALGREDAVHGILVQLPLPGHISEEKVLRAIDPEKDVDGFHPENFGLLCQGVPRFIPATPAGILKLLAYYEIPTEGRHVVVAGRSRIVGRPLANLLSAKSDAGNATVTLCHTRTRDLAHFTRQADILIAAAGQPRFVTAEMVSPGCVVIDVGIHRFPDPENPGKARLCGDVDFETVEPKVRAITPVPGGVGPMTVATVLENTVLAAERRSP